DQALVTTQAGASTPFAPTLNNLAIPLRLASCPLTFGYNSALMKFRFDLNNSFVLHRSTYFAVILTLLSTPILYSQQAPRPAAKLEHKTDVSIPMRDGIILR